MAKSPAERKAAQRKRQQEAGLTKIELRVDNQELEMLKRNGALRRPGREPYEVNEYLTLLIRMDDRSLKRQIDQLQKQQCEKCGGSLPVAECCFSGEAACWNTLGWHELKLTV
ncbi:hypothetical protein KKI95_16010 [Xenorhabdus bovienii]|uniref:hypothetical protein n=1 Tax=Xenorhabdus bovienii TaxID=40576 RepID=UPI0023B2456C|nr:hypothetical protein [Xenorhabdus bovienii]MDE9437392.1 hypothetical protein [Xenorhabdus bovienii]MDE9499259.1 hypothetical protein [Xenorhabdus bovienii]